MFFFSIAIDLSLIYVFFPQFQMKMKVVSRRKKLDHSIWKKYIWFVNQTSHGENTEDSFYVLQIFIIDWLIDFNEPSRFVFLSIQNSLYRQILQIKSDFTILLFIFRPFYRKNQQSLLTLYQSFSQLISTWKCYLCEWQSGIHFFFCFFHLYNFFFLILFLKNKWQFQMKIIFSSSRSI